MWAKPTPVGKVPGKFRESSTNPSPPALTHEKTPGVPGLCAIGELREPSITPAPKQPQTRRSNRVVGKKRESYRESSTTHHRDDHNHGSKERTLDSTHHATARREMNQWLADNGITGRTITLIDAMILLFRSLGDDR